MHCEDLSAEYKARISVPAHDLMLCILRSNTIMLIRCVISPASLKIFIFFDNSSYTKLQPRLWFYADYRRISGLLQRLISKSLCSHLLLSSSSSWSVSVLLIAKMHCSQTLDEARKVGPQSSSRLRLRTSWIVTPVSCNKSLIP
jgi:hypothetical protein